MGFPVLLLTLLFILLFSAQSQELKDQDALCTENSCLVIYLQRKTFLEAWRSCKSQNGNLVTVKSPQEAKVLGTLFSNMDLKEAGSVFVWIGLQRQPRKCSPNSPMRGFSWITGEQNAQYTNWLHDDSPSTCSAQRCVGIGYSTAAQKRKDNLKWKDGPCSIPVDGYLCKYTFPGMCEPIGPEAYGNTLYSTTFHLVSSFLTHVPFGSVATVPCLTQSDQTALCTHREDGTVGWNRDPPFCTDVTTVTNWCDQNNGGCHHICVNIEKNYYCVCTEGFYLADDGMSCLQSDPCQGSPCEFECLAVMDGYRCACPEGYMLALDEQSCLDVDECLQSPCEHICVNAQGSFDCQCRDGYRLNDEGACMDIDECAELPCEHDCENVMGSYNCHCHHGYVPLPEDPTHCYDVDECQIEGICQEMCSNYGGGFECHCKEGYELQMDNSCMPFHTERNYVLSSPQLPGKFTETHENKHQYSKDLDWLTEPPNVAIIPTDILWFTDVTQAVTETTSPTEPPPDTSNTKFEELETITLEESSFTSTSPPDYYEGESTTGFTVPPTSTKEDDTLKLFWLSPATEGITEETEQISVIIPSTYDSYDGHTDSPYFESTTINSELQTSSHFLQTDQGTKDGNSIDQTKGRSWLLVGLLVPFCLIFVVMVALGIIYCTRCTSKPKNKNATECYHWISGAGDKAASDMACGGITKV